MTEKETIICAIYRYVLIYYSIGDKVVKESQKSVFGLQSSNKGKKQLAPDRTFPAYKGFV